MLYINSSLRSLLLVIFTLSLAACGGGGSSDSSSSTNTISGNATKGVIDQGIVNAYRMTNGETSFIAATRTNSHGNFQLPITHTSTSAPILLELTSDTHTRMKCDLPSGCTSALSGSHASFGEWFALPADFSLLGTLLPGQTTPANISPLSHIIVATAAAIEGGLTTHNLATANAWLQADLRLAHDPLQTFTADITELNETSSIEEIEQGILSASFFDLVLSQQWQQHLVHLDELDLQTTFSNASQLALELSQQYDQDSPQIGAQLEAIESSSLSAAEDIRDAGAFISAQPQSSSVVIGEQLTLRVGTSGFNQPTYQWFKDNQPINGTSSNTFTIETSSLSDQGLYHAVASGESNTARSLSALITVYERELPFSVVQQPSSYALSPGQSATLNVVAEGGTGTYSYRWQKGGSLLPNETSSQLHINNATASDAGSYRVTIADDSTSITSEFANISVSSTILPVTIHQQPANVATMEGAELSLSINASGGGFLTYQWRRDGNNLSGQTSATLTINPAQISNSGTYDVRVSNSQGTEVSDTALVTVLSSTIPLSIERQPQSVSVATAGNARFTVEALAGTPLQYQWYHDDIAISNATGAQYELSNVTAEDEGAYYVEISSATETLTSLAALLTLVETVDLALSWDVPKERENGTPLQQNEISEYLIQYGTSALSFPYSIRVSGASTTDYTIEDLTPGTYYLRIATTDSDGITGSFSEVVTVTIP